MKTTNIRSRLSTVLFNSPPSTLLREEECTEEKGALDRQYKGRDGKVTSLLFKPSREGRAAGVMRGDALVK